MKSLLFRELSIDIHINILINRSTNALKEE